MNYTKEQIRVGAEKAFILDLIVNRFPKGIVSYVADSFNLWDVITKILPTIKSEILARDGKLVIRPDSGDPVDIICGKALPMKIYPEDKDDVLFNTAYNVRDGKYYHNIGETKNSQHFPNIVIKDNVLPEEKGVIELLWDIFGGTINEQGYKVLDPHIGAIYGDSITPERQLEIYKRLAAKGFAATNIILGIGSFSYQMTSRDTLGFAAKGAWFEVEEACPDCKDWTFGLPQTCEKCNDNKCIKKAYNIYKDPITDDGTKKSLKGLLSVIQTGPTSHPNCYMVKEECTPEWENKGLLQVIYEDGKFYNQTTLTEVRDRLKNS